MQLGPITPCSYVPGKLATYTFIRAGQGWDFHQGPALTRFRDGRITMTWGAYDIQECSNDGVVVYSCSADSGETWDAPQVWMSAPNAVVSHPQTVELRGTDDVLLVYREGHFHGAGEDKKRKASTVWANYGRSPMHLLCRRSNDVGYTWDPAVAVDTTVVVGRHAPPFYGGPEQAILLSDGSVVLLVVYLDPDRRDPQHFNVAVLRAVDGAAALAMRWEKVADFTVPDDRGAMEPCVSEVEPGRLLGFLRSRSGFLYEIEATDFGRCWRAPRKTSIPSVEAMSKVLALSSGALLLVWNNQSSTTGLPRHPLAAALSVDRGRSWGSPRILADEIGANQLSNFGVIQAADGRILVCTSHYRAQQPRCSDLDMVVFDEEWLRA
jgi:hypothetical protein